MNILALDTSFSACSVASGRDLGMPSAVSAGLFEPMATGHAERLVPMISEVLSAAGLAIDDVDRIAVTNGPGSFTGTRIAISAARALALATGAETVTASSLWVMAERAARALRLQDRVGEAAMADLVIAVDARRGEVYAQRFVWSGAAGGVVPACEPRVLSIESAAGLGAMKSVRFCGSAAEEVARRAAELGREPVACMAELLPDAADLLRLSLRLEPEAVPVRPLYLRPADAKPQAVNSIERA